MVIFEYDFTIQLISDGHLILGDDAEAWTTTCKGGDDFTGVTPEQSERNFNGVSGKPYIWKNSNRIFPRRRRFFSIVFGSDARHVKQKLAPTSATLEKNWPRRSPR